MLEHTYDLVDYISMHDYYEPIGDDLGSFLASSVDMDSFIGAVVATADHVGARLRHRKQLKISFDEWNVWYQSRFVGQRNLDWQYARELIEDEYSVVDAVVVGSFLITLLRHADRVAIACQAQLVNVIAPSGPARMARPGGRRSFTPSPRPRASPSGRRWSFRSAHPDTRQRDSGEWTP